MTRLRKQSFQTLFPAIALAILAHTSRAQARVDPFQQVVKPYVDAQMFMGNVLVVKNGKGIFSKS